MSIASYIQGQLSSCIRRIFRSTERLTDSNEEETEIIGKSLTDPYSFGLVVEVMGKSLTDFSLAEESETIFPSEVVWIDLDDDESEADTLPSIDGGIGFNDFHRLEADLVNDIIPTTETTSLGTVSKLKGSVLYDRLKENSETRSKISALLEKVDNGLSTGSDHLQDMSDFLDANVV